MVRSIGPDTEMAATVSPSRRTGADTEATPFSRYLAGHPEKNMLIDIYDGSTGKVIGEYGFGGFKLFTVTAPIR